jgi:hypothetical protein
MSVAAVSHVLTHRSAGPIASLAAAFLAVALAASVISAAATRAELEGRIARLSQEAQGVRAYWRARTAACESAAQAAHRSSTPIPRGDAAAAELATSAPQGFDACARMESADAAVLGTLK